jgi:hypothetical protein
MDTKWWQYLKWAFGRSDLTIQLQKIEILKSYAEEKHDTTAALRQSKVEQVYIKSKFGHSILLDTVNFWKQ